MNQKGDIDNHDNEVKNNIICNNNREDRYNNNYDKNIIK